MTCYNWCNKSGVNWEVMLLQSQFFHVSNYKKDCEICLYPYHCSFHNSLLTQEHEDVNFSYFFLNCFLYRLYLIRRRKKKSMMEKELPTLTLDYNTKKFIYSKILGMSVLNTPWTLFLSCMCVLTMLRWWFFFFIEKKKLCDFRYNFKILIDFLIVYFDSYYLFWKLKINIKYVYK